MSDRFPVAETLTQLPGCCFFCRNDTGTFVDTGRSIKFEGVVYVCNACVTEMYLSMNKLPEATVIEISPTAEELERGATDAAILTDAISVLKRLFAYVEPAEGESEDSSESTVVDSAESDKLARDSADALDRLTKPANKSTRK